jgi:hypothetical protein
MLSVLQSVHFVVVFRDHSITHTHTHTHTEVETNYWFGILNWGRRSQQTKEKRILKRNFRAKF